MDWSGCWYAHLTSCLKLAYGCSHAHTKRSPGYKRHINAEAAAGSSPHDLRVGIKGDEGGVGSTPLFHVCLAAAGLHQPTLLPFLLKLVQAGEHGWVH